jgi:uncharacterized protein (UPF0332 family)
MASYDSELLVVADRLLLRRAGQRGKLFQALIRRSISTSYYALFHFLLAESGLLLIGTTSPRLARRRILARSFSHAGIKAALEQVRLSRPGAAVAKYFRSSNSRGSPDVPDFVQDLARTFIDAQLMRHDADYDLNKPLSEADASQLRNDVECVIRDWRAANTPADRDFKQALAMLMLLGGKLRG